MRRKQKGELFSIIFVLITENLPPNESLRIFLNRIELQMS